MNINLKQLSDTIAVMEGGKHDLGSPQVAEVLGKLGEHFRSLTGPELAATVNCLVQRAGKRSRT